MAFIVTTEVEAEERIDRRDPEVTMHQVVKATDVASLNDTDGAKAAADAAAPTVYKGLSLASVRFAQVARNLWNSELLYKLQDGASQSQGLPGVGSGPSGSPPPTPAETDILNENFSFTTKGGTAKITQSVMTRSTNVPAGATVPDFKKAIGVSKDGVAGCDIITGKLEWSYSVVVPGVSMKYIRRLEELTGTVNLAPF